MRPYICEEKPKDDTFRWTVLNFEAEDNHG